MADYNVLGGHEYAEFRQHEDGSIELYSMEEDDDGEELGHVGNITEEEFREVGDTLDSVFNGDEEGVTAPELDDLNLLQHPLFGSLIFTAVDEDGEADFDAGASFSEAQTIIDAADALAE